MSVPQDNAPAGQDPLAQVTLRPRTFAAILAIAAMIVGLVLALVPMSVAGPDPADSRSISCGNVLGGPEADRLADELKSTDRSVIVSYVDMCERAAGNRGTTVTLLFFGGMIGGLWLGVVRRGRRDK
ncbi:hypothetical protein EV193_101670 [Herbihabitans rhizosphaerae]|uniref:Uncharacterized protein n=1 Tax=Herbihabitans rhizosphaerae TaxID=1872711 RepID=A0A4Q7L817_9PSEU|nr:hypothetical protein [Herbihabitans rhizosphaerae]RZS44791.1 hypothetical protein EV193_101670 [Herbihabitans rhizosphaerae]